MVHPSRGSGDRTQVCIGTISTRPDHQYHRLPVTSESRGIPAAARARRNESARRANRSPATAGVESTTKNCNVKVARSGRTDRVTVALVLMTALSGDGS
jgi:hypothetical protein